MGQRSWTNLVDVLGTAFARRRQQASARRQPFHGLEGLENRVMLSATLDWVNVFNPSGNASASGQSVALAGNGDVLTGGSFTGTIDVDPGAPTVSFTSNSSGMGHDGYAARYSPTGSLVEAWQFTGANAFVTVQAVGAEGDNVIIAGAFSGTIDLNPGSGTQNATSQGDNDVFLVKLDSNGDFVWGVTFGGDKNDYVSTMTVSGAHVALSGNFTGTTNLGTLGVTVNATDSSSEFDSGGFASVYSLVSGAFVEAYTLTGDGNGQIGDIARASNGDWVLVGGAAGTAQQLSHRTSSAVTDLFSFTPTGDGTNAFVARADGDALVWQFLLPPSGNQFNIAKFDGVALDASDNIYVAGQHAGEVDLDPGTGTNTLAAGQFSRPMVASYNSAGDHRWGFSLNGSEGETRDVTVGTVDSQTVVTFSGYFGGTANFDPAGTAFPLSSVANTGDAFVWQFNAAGTVRNAFVYGGGVNPNNLPRGYDDAFGVAVNAEGDLFTAGPFGAGFPGGTTTDFAPGAATRNIAAAGTGGGYVARYSPNSSRDSNSGGGGQQSTEYISSIDVAVTAETLPASVLSGTTTRGKATVTIENTSSQSLPRGIKANVQVFARPIGGGSDILLGQLTNASVSNLAAEATKNFTVAITLPDTAGLGEYTLVAVVTDPATSQSDTSATFSQFVVEQATIDLAPAINDAKYNPDTDVVSGDGTRFKLPVSITNQGNSPLTNGVVDIRINAIPQGGGDPILITTLEGVKLGTIKPGKTKVANLQFVLPQSLGDGSYLFQVVVDSANVVQESNENNNTDQTQVAVGVEEGFVDLETEITQFKLPSNIITGQSARGPVKIQVTSNSNITLPKTASGDISVVLRPVGAQNSSQDIEIGTLDDAKLGGLKPGKAKTFSVNSTIQNVAEGQYTLHAIVAPQQVVDIDDANDTDTVPQVFTIAQAQADLTPQANFPFAANATLSAGDTRSVLVNVRNEGTDTANGNVTVNILGSANGVGTPVTLGSVTVNNASIRAGGGSIRVTVPLTAPNAQTATPYTTTVQVQFSGNDSNNANNSVAGTTFVSAPSVLGQLGQMTFTQSDFVPAGNLVTSLGSLTSTSGNNGSYAWAIIRSFNGINPPKEQQLTASLELFGAIAGGSSGLVRLKFNKLSDRPESINGRTLRLTNAKTGNSLGTFTIPVLGNQTPNTTGFFEFA